MAGLQNCRIAGRIERFYFLQSFLQFCHSATCNSSQNFRLSPAYTRCTGDSTASSPSVNTR